MSDAFPIDDASRTKEQIAELEAERTKGYTERFKSVPKFTCSDCPLTPTCYFAFDWYNTDGDCLAEK